MVLFSSLVLATFGPVQNSMALSDDQTLAVDLTPDEQNNISVFSRTNKSVVYVANSRIERDFFTLNIYEIPAGTGTGFVWDKSGLIVTNFHVIEGASKISITLWDQSTWKAKIVGTAPNKDLALLKIDAPEKTLFPVKMGDSSTLEVGRKVLAIGNPFGLDTTLTIGVVSALGREIQASGRRIKGLIQTDAAINPGNSGGPLLNSKGELVGVNTLIYSPSGGSSGVGFAIPVNSIKKIIPQLSEFGKVMRPVIGINILDESIASRNGIVGVVILSAVDGTSAQKSGMIGVQRDRRGNIILGDVIVKIDDHVIQTYSDLYDTLELYEPGNTVVIETNRNGQKKSFTIQLINPEQ
ncbi:trypsin-like peptidase domain-containing protein [bacterium]|nr:trypsin-like peptidase domain-containing protein [bacterium]